MIKIKLSIDPTQPRQVEALNALLLIMTVPKTYPINFADPLAHSVGFKQNPGGLEIESKLAGPTVTGEEIAKTVMEEPKKTRKTKVVPVQEAEETKAADTEAENQANGPAESLVTIEQIREVLGKKVGDHRETIKAQLTELGAKNVSVLDPAHYDSFHAFLTAL